MWRWFGGGGRPSREAMDLRKGGRGGPPELIAAVSGTAPVAHYVAGPPPPQPAFGMGDVIVLDTPRAHATRLLRWFQIDGNEDNPAFGQAYTVTFAEVLEAYATMCGELRMEPLSWVAVGRHFSRLTGGRKYRNVEHPDTGLRTAKERIYRIPELTPARWPAHVRSRFAAGDAAGEPTPAAAVQRRAA